MSRGFTRSLIAVILLSLSLPVTAEKRENVRSAERGPAATNSEETGPLVFRHASMISIDDIQIAGETHAESVRAFIDPVTGELRAPTTEELATLDEPLTASVAASTEPLQIELASGAIMVELGPEWLNYSIATISGSDVHFGCADGHGPAAASGREEK